MVADPALGGELSCCRTEAVSCSVGRLAGQVAVEVRSDRHLRVPEGLRDQRERHARGEHQRGRQVAEVVDAAAPDAGLIGDRIQVAADVRGSRGTSVLYAMAAVTKTTRSASSNSDPQSTAPAAAGGGYGGYGDEPPW